MSSEKHKTLNGENWLAPLILVLGFVLRFTNLSLKPPHFDEGINGWFVDQAWANGFFQYDPTNYHGPLHFYLLQLSQVLLGNTITAHRLVACVFSFLTLVVVLKMQKQIGRAALWAALILAISPGVVFYARYAIHESELMFFLSTFVWATFEYLQKKSKLSIWVFVFSIAGMLVTKEVHFVFMISWFLAFVCVSVIAKYVSKKSFVELSQDLKLKQTKLDWWKAIWWGFLFVVLLFTGFGLYPQGFVSFFEAFMPWLKTGVSHTGHDKEFLYWSKLLWQYEWPILFSYLICLVGLVRGTFYFRILSVYSLGTFLAFSLIPYKTPWCIISFAWTAPFALGFFLEWSLQQKNALKVLVLSIFLVLMGQSIKETLRVNFKDYVLQSEPYVYVQTTNDFKEIFQPIFSLLQNDPQNYNMPFLMALRSTWPLPWVLRSFTHVEYLATENQPKTFDVILIDQDQESHYKFLFKKPYFRKPFVLRGAQEPSIAFFDAVKFSPYFPTSTEKIGEAK